MPPALFGPPRHPPPPLPPGWIQKWDTYYQSAYFIEAKSGTVQWEVPGHEGENPTAMSRELVFCHMAARVYLPKLL
ncbi:hypothetical protein BJX61DRAFT_515901 [Aspergillus egyptiacus]|nr:hypothetical protein BJX61DRAFT_515901 [Aspergillus egyptiacus]